MKKLLASVALAAALAVGGLMWVGEVRGEATVEPVRVLLVSGGGFHDYEAQKDILEKGLESRANIEVTVAHNPTDRRANNVDFDGYRGSDWAKNYDVVIHNVCSAKSNGSGFLPRVVAAHRDQGVGAVFIHCAMHTCRDVETDDWRQMLGVTSKNHEKHAPVTVTNAAPNHPVMRGFPATWELEKDELYRILRVWPQTKVLATGISGEKEAHPVIWVNQFGKARVFGSTLAHYNENMENDVYLGLVTRGALWTAGKLGDDGNPLPGYGK